MEEHFIKGRLFHTIVEECITRKESPNKVIETILPEWLEKDAKVDFFGEDFYNFLHYTKEMGKLLYRCSPVYAGDESAIRNANGEVPRDPLNFPPNIFKSLASNLGLYVLKSRLDGAAQLQSTTYNRFSLANAAAAAFGYSLSFSLPEGVEPIAVEYDFEKDGKEVLLGDNTQWIGKIDLVASADGDLLINDHKTGSKKPEEVEVLWHPQLNMYVQQYYEQTGLWAKLISIYHAPTATWVASEVNVDVVLSIYDFYQRLQDEILEKGSDAENFPKASPPSLDFCPCKRRDYKSGRISSACPYIRECWPGYTSESVVSNELLALLGPEAAPSGSEVIEDCEDEVDADL